MVAQENAGQKYRDALKARYVYAPNDMYINLMLEMLSSTRLDPVCGSAFVGVILVLFCPALTHSPSHTDTLTNTLSFVVVGVTFPLSVA